MPHNGVFGYVPLRGGEMPKRYYVYRLIDSRDGSELFQGLVELPVQTDGQSLNDNDARSMVADAAIRHMIRSPSRPVHSVIQFCEVTGHGDERLGGEGENFTFDWTRCEPAELELELGEEE